MRPPKARKPLFERLKAGMEEAIRHARGEVVLKTTVVELPDPPPDMQGEEVARLRQENRLSQAAFARLLNVSTRTVQNWERGISKPSQAALRLLQVLRLEPDGLLRAAGMAAASEDAAIPALPRSTSRRSSDTASR